MTLDLVSKKNPFLLVVLSDFNAKLSQWYDKDSSTSEGISIETVWSLDYFTVWITSKN